MPGIDCSLTTGEEEDRRAGDTHVAATAEKLDLKQPYEVAVIDECQMIADRPAGAMPGPGPFWGSWRQRSTSAPPRRPRTFSCASSPAVETVMRWRSTTGRPPWSA